jgi:hypothetical protein
MKALGFGELARVAIAHRVYISWIVHTAERSGGRRLGCNEFNSTDGLARE